MIARIQKSIEEKDKGFTLIELLVVMIIIGILAAIAIPVFLNQRKKAVDTGIKSDLRTIANELESYYVDEQAYPASSDVDDSSGSVTVGSGGAVVSLSDSATDITYTLDSGGESYSIQGTNSKGTDPSTGFTYDSDGGGLQ